MPKEMNRRTAREFVLHMIFQGEFTLESGEEILSDHMRKEYFESMKAESDIYELMPGASQEEYITLATSGVLAHVPELDAYIEKYTRGWGVDRISRVAKCILRLCMFEILYMQIPTAASVNEALELTKKYDGEEAAGFVNGIMGSFVKGEQV